MENWYEQIRIKTEYIFQKITEHTFLKMNEAFEKSSKLEWIFWDSAYNKELWKI